MIAAMQAEPEINFERTVAIAAPVEIVFETILGQLGPESEMPDGTKFPMVFEAWPGGRWYRDLGNNAGHLWGHVQVIKPPTLIEICGPLFMSYPAINFVRYRIAANGKGAQLKMLHQAMGMIPTEHRENVSMGWDYEIKKIVESAERRAAAR